MTSTGASTISFLIQTANTRVRISSAAVIRTVERKTAPSAAYVEHPVPRPDQQLGADHAAGAVGFRHRQVSLCLAHRKR